jgi:hypothetical protein
MLVFGAASNAWDMLSSLQPINANAPGGIGVGQFAADISSPASPAASGLQSMPPPTGTAAQASLSPDVLGFMIWNQSQQPGAATSPVNGAGPAGTTGLTQAPTSDTSGGVDTNAFTTWPQSLSWFLPLSADGSGNAASSGPNPPSGGNGNAPAAVTSPSQLNAESALPSGEPGAAPASTGARGHHHHHGGFAIQSQAGQSDPLANLLGASAQGASSASAVNADGSTTTTITYADGSEVTLTTPAQASGANPSPTAAAQLPFNSNNFLENLIQLQARLLAPTAAA